MRGGNNFIPGEQSKDEGARNRVQAVRSGFSKQQAFTYNLPMSKYEEGNQMKAQTLLFVLAAALLTAGCAATGNFGAIQPGESMAAVEQQAPAPSMKRLNANGGQTWAYDSPNGRACWILNFGPGGNLTDKTQTLVESNFVNLRAGQSTREDVTWMLCNPYRKFHFNAINQEVWYYRYINGSIYKLLQVTFDARTGLVKEYAMNPDPDVYGTPATGLLRY
jgi:hypothetical protein